MDDVIQTRFGCLKFDDPFYLTSDMECGVWLKRTETVADKPGVFGSMTTFLPSDDVFIPRRVVEEVQQLGMMVKIKMKPGGFWGGKNITHHNVTEVHYNYNHDYLAAPSVAIESNIHSMGITYDIKAIDEFEVFPEDRVWDSF